MANLSEVIDIINGNSSLSLNLSKYQEIRTVLLTKLQELDGKNFEEVANLNFYLLVLGLKCNQINLDEVDRVYVLVKNGYENEEKSIKSKIKAAKGAEKKLVKMQMQYFYKLVEHSFNNLEELFKEKYFFDHAKKAFADKLEFRAHHRFFEHEFIDYFEYKRTELTNRFRGHYVLYTLFGGIGMIVFWRGIWDLTYEIPFVSNNFGAIITGLFLMTITGFIASVGDRSLVSTQDKYEE